MERFHEVYSMKRNPSLRIKVVRGEIDKKINRLPDQITHGQKYKATQNREKTRMGKEQTKLDTARRQRDLLYRT